MAELVVLDVTEVFVAVNLSRKLFSFIVLGSCFSIITARKCAINLPVVVEPTVRDVAVVVLDAKLDIRVAPVLDFVIVDDVVVAFFTPVVASLLEKKTKFFFIEDSFQA